MKENQLEVLFHSNGYEKGVDLLSYSTTELCQENGSETNLDTLARGLANMDGFLRHPKDCEKKSVESLASRKDNYGLNPCSELQSTHSEASFRLLGSDLYAYTDTPCSELKSTHSEASFRLLGSDRYVYTDKNVVECELPELDVPSNVHIVKDICVDTGVVPHERTLIESKQGDNAASIYSQTINGDVVRESVNGDLDTEVFFPDQFEGSAVEDTKTNSTKIYGSWSWVTFDSVEPDESKSSLEDNAGTKMDEQSLTSSDNIADIVSEDASSISSTRVSEEFKMQDSLLSSLKQEGNKVAQQPDEVPSLDTILESLAVMFTSKDRKKEDLVNKLSYNSKVEGGTITFDFKSSKLDVPNNKDGNAEITNGKSTEASDEKPEDESSTATTLVEHAGNVEMVVDNDHDQDPSRQEDASKKDVHPGPTTQVPCAEGDSSFAIREPVSGLITYSGQITYAGSTSLRSDSSTTSTRSFAFPVLQSEWNSSPVRMQKADRRRTRNHKFWRNGFFCCRF